MLDKFWINVYLKIVLIQLLITVSDAGCPDGQTTVDLDSDTLTNWNIQCTMGAFDSVQDAVKTDRGGNNEVEIPDQTSCSFVLASSTNFVLKRISFWTNGATSVRLQISTGDPFSPTVAITEEIEVPDEEATSGTRVRHLITGKSGIIPKGGFSDTVSFRLTFTQHPDAPSLKLRRMFARACVSSSS